MRHTVYKVARNGLCHARRGQHKHGIRLHIRHCRKRGVSAEQYIDFVTLLNNDALLDCITTYKPPDETSHAFVYILWVLR